MSLQHIQKNSPRLLPKPAKFEKNPPNGYRVIRKTKCGAAGAGGAGGARSSPIHKQASLAGRLIMTMPSKAWVDLEVQTLRAMVEYHHPVIRNGTVRVDLAPPPPPLFYRPALR